MSIRNLDHAYDEYLKEKEASVIPAIPAFLKRLENSAFRYGRFTIPTFYKPFFLSPKQGHLLKRVSATLSQVINTAVHLYFEESHLSHVYHIPPEAAELIKIDPGYSQPVIFSRFDAILEGESLKVVEFNCDAPAGLGYADQLQEILSQEKLLKDFFEKYQVQFAMQAQHILDSLLAAYEEFGGFESPQIAIVDWRGVRTAPECEYLKTFFESKGYKAAMADPRELRYKSGKLYHKNFKVDLIYRRAIFDEILEHLDEVGDMIKAYKERTVCMVNPLRSRLAGTKALMSILTNPEYDHFFTETENRTKREHIPWTRRLVDAEDFYGGKKIYLIDFLKDEKDTLVLKPSARHSREVMMGRETPDNVWNETIDKALKGDWIVQEFVNVPIMTVPTVINQKLDFLYKKFNFSMNVCHGKYTNAMVRLSDESMINVAKGGGLIAALVSDYIPERFEG